ncbi:MAG: argininosuccinate lyase [Candidatus Omnitrophica bacterium]|nr:argininosuccinate lyase [Candidatus Omnitrophota bacterium]
MKKTRVIPALGRGRGQAPAGIKIDPRFREDDRRRKLWGGRFSRPTSRTIERFTRSLSVDGRLARADLLGSIAHARMLGQQRIIPRTDSARLVRALQRLLRQQQRGRLRLDPSAEDVHTAIHSLLARRAGPAGERLHSGRSRNDQVVTDLRLHCRERAAAIGAQVRELQRRILSEAERAEGLLMPGYTHLRHAQPMLVSHALLAYLPALQRDRERLRDAARRCDELPLGAGALVGSGLPLNRASVARALGFARVMENSVDAVTSRDFAAELLFDLAMLSVHLSRISEDFILWSTSEFGFVRFDERALTGSSMMPQKQNPDFLELTRGGCARLVGNLTAMLTLLKGLPSGYQRDLQLDKEILFEGMDRAEATLEALTRGLRGLSWDRKGLARQLGDESLYATDLAEYLVAKGVPFARAHRAVGLLLSHAAARGTSLRKLDLTTLRRFSVGFGPDAHRLLDPAASVRRKRSPGSTNPAMVRQAIRRWRQKLRP